MLRKKSAGPKVLVLVKALRELGYYSGPDSNLFDQEVYKAVRAFQMQNVDVVGRPLVVDGIAGPVTLGAIGQRISQIQQFDQTQPELPVPDQQAGGIALAALAVAIAEYNLGHGEVGGNNRGPHVRKYLDGRADEGKNWCAALVSWCYRETGRPMPFDYSLGARDIRNQCRHKGLDFEPTVSNPPRAGDLIIWWRVAPSSWQGHIGFVLDYRDGVLTTIEGNKTPKIGRFDYTLATIDRLLGFARID